MPYFAVLVSHTGAGPLFWTGKTWSSEFPDAAVFDTFAAGKEALAKVAAKSSADVSLVEGYGSDDENVALTTTE